MRAAELLPLILPDLPPDEVVAAPDPTVAGALGDHGWQTRPGSLTSSEQPVGAVLLLSGEVSSAGDRGPTLVDTAVRATRPGGLVGIAVPSAVHGHLTGLATDGPAGLTAAGLHHMLLERGLEVELLAAPGAAATIARRAWRGADDLADDTVPGLLDAGPVLLALGRTPRDPAERSARFWRSINRRILASSVICTDDRDRVLVVFDVFKRHWTLPGGLVDAGEDPKTAAGREAWEEGGVQVDVGDLLGVFSHAGPDALNLVYAARPVTPTPEPEPVHVHEVSEARWVSRAEAEAMLPAHVRRRVQLGLDRPGGTWSE